MHCGYQTRWNNVPILTSSSYTQVKVTALKPTLKQKHFLSFQIGLKSIYKSYHSKIQALPRLVQPIFDGEKKLGESCIARQDDCSKGSILG